MMKKYGTIISVCLGLMLLLFACKDKKEQLTIDYHYNYFPVDSGHYVIYNVDSITYSYNGQYTYDTVHFQWMQIITDTFYDNNNQLNYRLEVYRRPDSLSQWGIDRVWFESRTAMNALKTEDDVKYVKLVFPPSEGEDWNGNIYIPANDPYTAFEGWDYTYANVHQPFSVNGYSFDSTVTVNEVNEDNLIEKKLRTEVYAANVGMVYQEWEVMSKQNVSRSWDDPQGPENGFRIRMRIAGHN